MKDNQHFQNVLSQSKLKQDDDMRKRVNTYKDVEKGTVQEDSENDLHQKDGAKQSSSEQGKEDNAIHPFLDKKSTIVDR